MMLKVQEKKQLTVRTVRTKTKKTCELIKNLNYLGVNVIKNYEMCRTHIERQKNIEEYLKNNLYNYNQSAKKVNYKNLRKNI